MCGIIGYTGTKEAKEILIDGLEQLEYRGYDSAGIVVGNSSGTTIVKRTGKVDNLREAVREMNITGTCGIGHTRWATHGGVTEENTHPHSFGKVTLVHNGIIENYHELATKYGLTEQLVSETDSEVAAGVLNHFYTGDPYKAIAETVRQLEGTYGFCIIFEDRPNQIFAIRNVSPMVAAVSGDGTVIASDLTAIIPYTKEYFIVPEQHILTMNADKIIVTDLEGKVRTPKILTVNWDVQSAQKNGYPHFMLKEIYEQPEAIKRTILPRIVNGLPDFTADEIADEMFRGVNQIYIVACGTAMYAGMVAKTMIQPLMRIPVEVAIASEFRYDDPVVDEETLVIGISQSGETIDTLEAMRLAKRRHARTLAIVNVKGSSIARECDNVIYTHAGPEIAVASTKAYTVQLAAMYLLGCKMGYVNGKYTVKAAKRFTASLLKVIDCIEAILKDAEKIKACTSAFVNANDAFMIGRGLDYVVALEGSLKLKEISYIHAEAYAAGELKHGTIALISDNVPVVALATQDKVFAKTISNIREVKARGAFVILITKDREITDQNVCDVHFKLPQIEEIDDMFLVFPTVVILQLLAYHTSVSRGLDVDKPRNLAKSVTVE